MSCACGCAGRPMTGKRYIHGHNLKHAHTKEWRRAHGHRVAASRPKAFWQAMGARGARTTRIQRWVQFLEQWQGGQPRVALRKAWELGYQAGYQAGLKRGEQKGRAA